MNNQKTRLKQYKISINQQFMLLYKAPYMKGVLYVKLGFCHFKILKISIIPIVFQDVVFVHLY